MFIKKEVSAVSILNNSTSLISLSWHALLTISSVQYVIAMLKYKNVGVLALSATLQY